MQTLSRDAEWEGYVPGTSLWAEVDKVGGGTPPRQYDGEWDIILRYNGRAGSIAFDARIRTGLPTTHAMAAVVAAEFMEEDDC